MNCTRYLFLFFALVFQVANVSSCREFNPQNTHTQDIRSENIRSDTLGLVQSGNRDYSVYALYEQGSETPYYIGITRQDIDVRMNQHIKTGRYGETTIHKVLETNLTEEQARGFEQAYIEHYGTKTGDRKKPISLSNRGNAVNSFDKSRTDRKGKTIYIEYEKAKEKIKGKNSH